MMCLYITSESPSNTTSCRLILMAKEMALLQANASKSSIVGGKPMHSNRASIMKPSESHTTTLRLAKDMSWKIAPSQLVLMPGLENEAKNRHRRASAWPPDGPSLEAPLDDGACSRRASSALSLFLSGGGYWSTFAITVRIWAKF